VNGWDGKKARRVHLIACGVLALDLNAVLRRLGVDATATYMPGGLHNSPRELQRRLQETIDAVSRDGGCDLIALGYGVCGRGSVGLKARSVPLAIPLVQDCIALFLGSDAEYRKQFALNPGTYYVAAGWVEENARPWSEHTGGQAGCSNPIEYDYDKLVAKYGEEEARAIAQFLSTWQRNYSRSVFIDTGEGHSRAERYSALARDMAKEFGWQYEHIRGTHGLLEKLLTARESTDEILVVPPGYVTTYDGIRRRLGAAPVAEPGMAETASPPLVLDSLDSGGAELPLLARLGLGIDAGGTFTDAVLYDFRSQSILAKAKSLTTRWDYALGIEQAIDGLDSRRLAEVDLVSVSTTLATNAIVEERGQRVALLLMTPYGWKAPENFTHDLIAVVSGQLEIDGKELVPVDPAQVRRIVREMIDRQGIRAFAVAGYASHVNPAHELQVMAAVREETDATVTCAHDIAGGINYRIRAETAVLNARIIPALDAFLSRVQVVIRKRGLQVPIMVVRSDGSLMSLAVARSRPVETILSGPAASVAGASYLTGAADALIVDIGGTTTDTAAIRHGVVRTCPDGAKVGRWKTHVEALDMRTLGLGGDSRIAWRSGKLEIGPRRIAPVAWLASRAPGISDALRWLENRVDRFTGSTRPMELLALTPYEFPPLTDDAMRVVRHLRSRPFSVDELVELEQCAVEQFLPIAELEESHVIQRCGLTPTDLLHARGDLSLWDAEASRTLCDLYARVCGVSRAELIEMAVNLVVRNLALEILKKQMGDELEKEDVENSPSAMALIERALEGRGDGYSVQIGLNLPVIGIGAPAPFFIPQAAIRLRTKAVVPENGDVANAIGAITSPVRICRRATIGIDEKNRFRVEGVAGTPAFARIEEAQGFAVERLCEVVRDLGRKSGTTQSRVEVTVRDRMGQMSDGNQVFLERLVEARLTGSPDLTRFAM
jgi:N-methylhydantoinase A/oxoprolinase/acetone carboxylase beta subunit